MTIILGSPYADANQLLAASAGTGITMVPIASTAPLNTMVPMGNTMSKSTTCHIWVHMGTVLKLRVRSPEYGLIEIIRNNSSMKS